MTGLSHDSDKPMYIMGLMSGTSLDGIDAAMLQVRDTTFRVMPQAMFRPYSPAEMHMIQNAIKGKNKKNTARIVTRAHIECVQQWLDTDYPRPDLIGFHGQTILHDPTRGKTIQIGCPQTLAQVCGVPVVADLRLADMAQGGQGAPLVPVYHKARLGHIPAPVMIVNVGGVCNVTYVDQTGVLIAFDCGPGNASLNDWVWHHRGQAYDKDGQLAQAGQVDHALVTALSRDAYFDRPPPKSLDRDHFSLNRRIAHLSVTDGAATLTAMIVRTIAMASRWVPMTPELWYISGGGRHNQTLMASLKTAITSGQVLPIEDRGWNGDMIEAEAFAYLAMCHVRNWPVTFPMTTGVKKPRTGGRLYPPDIKIKA